MAKELYTYAVTRVHAHEQNLLSRQDIEQLISAANAAECFRMLSDKGWGGPEVPENNPDALIAAEMEKTWSLVEELAGDISQFNVFKYANDFHNLKAAIKLAYSASTATDTDRYFQGHGTVPLEMIVKAADEHDFSLLPPALAKAGREAYEALAHTGNGQACDMAIDRVALVAIYKAGTSSQSELLGKYARLLVDSANIKAAVRCCLMKKPMEFVERAIAPAGTLDTKALAKAATEDLEAVYARLRYTDYEDAVETLQVSLAAFECWCDNQLIEMIKPQRFNYFTIEPIAAFILGRENEIRMVRLVLSAKINNLGAEALRERLRDMYV